MLAIKLQRRGKKHQPSYRLVVQEKHSKLNGDFIDDLGSYDPRSKIAQIKGDRVKHWIGVGAKATPTVNNLLVTKGIITGEKVSINKPAFKEKVVEVVKPETLKEIKAEVVEVAEEVEVARDEKPEIIAEKEVEVTEALKEEPKKEE
ncbi:MAG: 30S ribosomal protein S16 [bacterium]|nr:30S ribosomal protein S16 [bacterium]